MRGSGVDVKRDRGIDRLLGRSHEKVGQGLVPCLDGRESMGDTWAGED